MMIQQPRIVPNTCAAFPSYSWGTPAETQGHNSGQKNLTNNSFLSVSNSHSLEGVSVRDWRIFGTQSLMFTLIVFTKPAPRPIQSESQHVRPSVCPLPVKIISRPFIGPQVTLPDPRPLIGPPLHTP